MKTVFVGLSGGVDSSVAALRLLRDGYDVVGVFIKVWNPDFLVCNWEEERLDAMRVAAHLKIPFLTCDAKEAYKKHVGDYFVREYLAGRTPNPDVMCNKFVKFGAFIDFARAHGADFVATGHYAQRKERDGACVLTRGADAAKDQSYFLWTLTKEQLAFTLFPVGNSEKAEIRREAERAGLPTAEKKDSQGICFLGHVDIPEFMSHFTELKEGDVLDERGNVIGTHKGALVYTLGQRHGFTVRSTTTQYVVAKDIAANTITVAERPHEQERNDALSLSDVNWIGAPPAVGATYDVQFRYRQVPVRIALRSVSDDAATIALEAATETPAAGQSCVFYDGDVCLGGGVVA